MKPSTHVVHFQRLATPGNFSVERLFDDVRRAMPEDVEVALQMNRHPSRGIIGRILDAVEARRRRGFVNHILGDVHYLAWFLPREGTLLTVLDCVSLERMSGLRLKLFWFLWYWWPLRRASRVTVISEYTRDSLLRWVDFPAERIHVIPPPLSGEFATSPAPPRGERLRLLLVGTTPNKNLPRVVEAVRDLPVTLIIVGRLTQAERADLARYNVSFENYFDLAREQLFEQYRRADALVMASTYEGFGLPIIEAHAVGRPVVTSNLCSMPEAAADAALLVDPYDVADIRRAIQRLIDEPETCTELVKRGHVNAARYAPARIAAEYANVYRTMNAHGHP